LVVERLGRLAVASHADARTKESGLNVAFLVERGRVDAFAAALPGLQAELGERIRLRCVGPLPPYSFTDQDVGEAAWA
jgi:hypothetical protein